MSGSKNYGIVPAPHLGESWDYRHHPGEGAQWPGVCPSTGECPHLILEGAETTGTTQRGCPATRSAPSDQGVCSSTRECPHLISEGAETTGTTLGRVPSDRECAQRPGVCQALPMTKSPNKGKEMGPFECQGWFVSDWLDQGPRCHLVMVM